ncbi:ferrochelatase [Telmatospirillum sp.]|uniref:ferrochelatase n=1 Tax=Telmatospirillum sp. TaxID=2079197 RepID=UPI00284B177C|nr:ferrochelatase [Telmatospirillum sp.]MDR3439605.1 ferrochelatase [Telmatospirillum sp.]
MGKLAVVLFNLGGPDSPAAIQPFLYNLFNDPAIIGAPAPIRKALAWFISTRRAPVAAKIYAHLGGRSPLLDLTKKQAEALQARLGDDVRVFVAMRYWHPMTDEVVAAVRQWEPDQIVLLPLYPQFSTTTTGSSIGAWTKAAAKMGLTAPAVKICCFPTEVGMIEAQAELLAAMLEKTGPNVRVLFSAHGLPKKVILRGDPYQSQIEMTAAAIVRTLGRPDLDWRVTYQSRVGPMEWIGPATDAEIRLAGAEGKSLVIQPIAFVSEHSETLVELDIEYRHLAEEAGVPTYLRVPALGDHPAFIGALAALVERALVDGCNPCSERGGRLCEPRWAGCPQLEARR